MRTITVVYGPAYEANSMLKYGGDVYVETSPRKWARIVDLPSGHPACLAASQGTLKAASIFMLDGTLIPALNALDPEHRELAAKEGLSLPQQASDGLNYLEKSVLNYNKVTDRMQPMQQQVREQRRNVSEPDKNELLRKVDVLREKLNILEDDEPRQKLLLMKRLQELMQKIQTTKNEDYATKRAILKMRVAKLQNDVAKLAEEDKGIDTGDSADFKKPKDVQTEFIEAVQKLDMNKDSHVARQLEALFAAHSITDFEDYFGNPENMSRLRKLAGLA